MLTLHLVLPIPGPWYPILQEQKLFATTKFKQKFGPLKSFTDRHQNQEVNQRDVRFMTKPLARELRPAVEAIDFITTAMENEDDDSTIEDEWKYIALIIGMVFLDSHEA